VLVDNSIEMLTIVAVFVPYMTVVVIQFLGQFMDLPLHQPPIHTFLSFLIKNGPFIEWGPLLLNGAPSQSIKPDSLNWYPF